MQRGRSRHPRSSWSKVLSKSIWSDEPTAITPARVNSSPVAIGTTAWLGELRNRLLTIWAPWR